MIIKHRITTLVAAALLCATVIPAQAWADTPVQQPASTTQAPPDTGTGAPPTTSPPTGASPTTTTQTPTPTSTTTPPTTTTSPTPAKKAVLTVYAQLGDDGLVVPGVQVQLNLPYSAGPARTPATFALPPGAYQFTVVSIPGGYELADPGPLYTGVITGTENTAQVVHLRKYSGEPTPGSFQLTKRSRITGEPLADATFRIVTCRGTVARIVTTDSTGVALSTLEPGCYDFIENVAPAGYQLDTTPHRLWIKEGDLKEATVYDTPIDYVATRNPSTRVPIQSVPTGRIS